MIYEAATPNPSQTEDRWQPDTYQPDTIHDRGAHEAWKRGGRRRDLRLAGAALVATAALTGGIAHAEEVSGAVGAGVEAVTDAIIDSK